jgi:hippurate hydrolase
MLVRDHPRTKVAYLLVGIAEPARVAAAQKEGKIFPFYNHNPGDTVDLASIPIGPRIAALTVLELLSTP